MAEGMLTISMRVMGRRKKLLDDWSIPLEPNDFGDGDSFTLRELITRIVLNTVAEFRKRQEENRFVRALTQKQMEDQAVTGKIDSGGRDYDQKVDDDEAVANALVAFEDGLYLVIIDDKEYRDLDAQVFLNPDTRVTFLRMVMLAGG